MKHVIAAFAIIVVGPCVFGDVDQALILTEKKYARALWKDRTRNYFAESPRHIGHALVVKLISDSYEYRKTMGVAPSQEELRVEFLNALARYNDKAAFLQSNYGPKAISDTARANTHALNDLAALVTAGGGAIVTGSVTIPAAVVVGTLALSARLFNNFNIDRSNLAASEVLRSDAAQNASYNIHGLDDIVGSTARLADSDPIFQGAYDAAIGIHTNAKFHQNAHELLRDNPEFRNQVQTRQVHELVMGKLRPDGTMELSVRQIMDLNAKHNLATQQQLESLIRHLGKKEQVEQRQRMSQLDVNSVAARIYLLSTFIELGDKRTAQLTAAVGYSGIAVYQAVDRFRNALASASKSEFVKVKELSSLILAADMAGIAKNLVGVIVGGPSPDEIMIEQINGLRKQLVALGEEMHGRFDQVDKSLNIIYREILGGFRELHGDVQAIRRDIQEMKVSLKHMESGLASIQQMLQTYLSAGFGRQLEREAIECLNASYVSQAGYENCLVRFEHSAVEVSKDPIESGDPGSELMGYCPVWNDISCLNGRVSEIYSPQWSQSSAVAPPSPAASPTGNPAWYKINLWSAIAERYFSDPFTAPGERLINPGVWARYATGFAEFVLKHPDRIRYSDTLAAINRLMDMGSSFEYATANIFASQNRLGIGRSPTYLFENLIANYKGALVRVAKAVENKIRLLNSAKSHFGYDIWTNDLTAIDPDHNRDIRGGGGGDGRKRFSIGPFLPFCERAPNKELWDSVKLKVEGSVFNNVLNRYEFLPGDLLREHHLGGRSLEICWEGAYYRLDGNTREDRPLNRNAEPRKYYRGNINVVLRVLVGGETFTRYDVRTTKVYDIEYSSLLPGADPAKHVPVWTLDGLLRDLGTEWGNGLGHIVLKEYGSISECEGGDRDLQKRVLEQAHSFVLSARNQFRRDDFAVLADDIQKEGKGSELGRAVAQVEGAKRLIDIFANLALPSGMLEDELRSILRGDHAIPGGLELAEFFSPSRLSNAGIDFASVTQDGSAIFRTEAERRANTVVDIVKAQVAAGVGNQIHTVIDTTLFQLEITKKFAEIERPQISPDQAIGEIREKVNAYTLK